MTDNEMEGLWNRFMDDFLSCGITSIKELSPDFGRCLGEFCRQYKARTTLGTLEPILDQIVVLPEAKANETKSGIVLPDQAKEVPWRGKVLALGPLFNAKSVVQRTIDCLLGRVRFGPNQHLADEAQLLQVIEEHDPKLLASTNLAVGDTVYYTRWHGTPVSLNGVDYIILDSKDLLGKVVEE